MNDAGHVGQRSARTVDAGQERVRVHIVGKAQRDEILPFFTLVEPVDDQDVVVAAAIELPDDATADQAGAARDDDAAASETVHGSNGLAERDLKSG